MPAQLSYPGVYLQEVRGGDRAITGVATAVTAFVGRTRQGPVGVAVRVHSFGEFERVFGGLWDRRGLSYAVRDYYLNGGQDAVIVRLYAPQARAGENADGKARADIGDLLLVAAVQGSAATQGVGVTIRHADAEQVQAAAHLKAADTAEQMAAAAATEAADEVKTAQDELTAAKTALGQPPTPEQQQRVADAERAVRRRSAEAAAAEAQQTAAHTAKATAAAAKDAVDDQSSSRAKEFGLDPKQTFHLYIVDADNQTLESYTYVTVADGPRRIDHALETSAYIRAEHAINGQRPAETAAPVPLAGGGDGGVLDAQAYGVSAEFVPALQGAGEVSLLCLPPSDPAGVVEGVWAAAAAFCAREDVFLLIDAPPRSGDGDLDGIADWASGLNLAGAEGRNAAVYFPRLRYADPLREGAVGEFAPCGAVAGIMARTDSARGVWKAPAGIEATLVGVSGLAVELTDAQNGELNPLAINCLRTLPAIGSVVWGARTMAGADALADEYKYIPVRRLALFLKESLYRGTQWVVFEPNDAGLWSQIRTTLGAFMQDLFKQGAFQGSSPREAYFVKCDAETTTQFDIDRGIVNIQVGFAPLKPAEFVVISIQQKTAAA